MGKHEELQKKALVKLEAKELMTSTEIRALPDGEYDIEEFTHITVENTSCRWTTLYRVTPRE